MGGWGEGGAGLGGFPSRHTRRLSESPGPAGAAPSPDAGNHGQPPPPGARRPRGVGPTASRPGPSRGGACARGAGPASPAKRILTRSSGWSTRVETTPPLSPAARFSSCTWRSGDRTGGGATAAASTAHAGPWALIAGGGGGSARAGGAATSLPRPP